MNRQNNFTKKGIVLKRSDYGDNNCILSLFTKESGIVKAVIYGVKRKKINAKTAAGQFLCYGDYELYQSSDIASVNSVNITDAFLTVTSSIAKLSLCAYMAETVIAILGENVPDERLFNIFLNCVYALAYRDDSIAKVKSVFEMKLMCAEGYAPEMRSCVVCGSEEIEAFDTMRGGMVCAGCMRRTSVKISAAVYKMLYYITHCPDKKMLSFTGSDVSVNQLGKITERYLLDQSDREFRTLDYFKAVKDM